MKGWSYLSTCLNIPISKPSYVVPVKLLSTVSEMSNVDIQHPSYQLNIEHVIQKVLSDLSKPEFTLNKKEIIFLIASYQAASKHVPGLYNYLKDAISNNKKHHDSFYSLLTSSILSIDVRRLLLSLRQQDEQEKFVKEYLRIFRDAEYFVPSILNTLNAEGLSLLLIAQRIEKSFRGLAKRVIISNILTTLPVETIIGNDQELMIFCEHISKTYHISDVGNLVLDKLRNSNLSPKLRNLINNWISDAIDINHFKRTHVVKFANPILGEFVSKENALFLKKFLDWSEIKSFYMKDPERQRFWLVHWDRADEYELHKKSGAVALRFGSVWIIEKSANGAIYFYDQQRYLEKKSETRQNFIDDNEALRVRLTHVGNWQLRLTTMLNELYRGGNVLKLRSLMSYQDN